MRCILWNTPATADIQCGIKWAYLSYEPALSHACAILNFDVPLFLQSDKWDGKFPHQNNKKKTKTRTHTLRAHTALISTLVSELSRAAWRDSASQAGGSACHRIVAFSVEHHYDNEHSFPIISTSWVTFPLMSRLKVTVSDSFIYCIARQGYFWKITFINSALENICDNL